jgi:heat shock protein HslJ
MNIRNLLQTFFSVIFLTLAITACTSGTDAPGDTGDTMSDIVGGWNAVTIDGENVIQPTVPNIIFGEDGTVTGNGTCNGYGGTYTVNGRALTIGTLVSTEMACAEPDLMMQETNFFDALTRVTGFTRDGDTLNLTAADGTIIVSLTAVAG